MSRTMKKNKWYTKKLIELKGKKSLRAFADELKELQSTLWNYLAGREYKVSTARAICLATGCDANWLLGLTEKNVANPDIKIKLLEMAIGDMINGGQDALKQLKTNFKEGV